MTGEKRPSGAELLAEVEWLLDGGAHPLLVAQELHRTVASIEQTARRYGRKDLGNLFGMYAHEERRAA